MDQRLGDQNAFDLQRLHRNDRSMIWWIFGSKARDETPSVQLLLKFGLTDITVVLS